MQLRFRDLILFLLLLKGCAPFRLVLFLIILGIFSCLGTDRCNLGVWLINIFQILVQARALAPLRPRIWFNVLVLKLIVILLLVLTQAPLRPVDNRRVLQLIIVLLIELLFAILRDLLLASLHIGEAGVHVILFVEVILVQLYI
jgi:hypothetical protein